MAKILHRYDGFEAWISQAERSPGGSSKAEGRSHSWDFSVGWDGAMDLARRGWPEGTNRVNAIALRIGDRLATKLQREEWNTDVTGVEIDVATMLSGEPECWLTPEVTEIEVSGRGYGVVKIVLNACVSGGVDAAVLERRGAAVAAFAQLLERTGRPVAIDVVFANRAAEGMLSIIALKAPGQPMDMDRLAFALAHPASLRRIQFAVWETEPADVRRRFGFLTHCGYGQVGEAEAEFQGDVYIRGAVFGESQWRSEESSTEWVLNELRTFGAVKD